MDLDSEKTWVWIVLAILWSMEFGGGEGCSAGLQRADACDTPNYERAERW